MNHCERGRRAEQLAARYLRARGYRIWKTNWRWGRKELDLVTQIIVETVTKTRQGLKFATIFPPVVLEDDKKFDLIPAGSIAWKQGITWWHIPPPWVRETPVPSRYPPMGAVNVGGRTPKETVQMIGKARAPVPEAASIDLGVVDIFISNYGKKIEFGGEGEETKVGMSLPTPTRGMSIGTGVMVLKTQKKPKKVKPLPVEKKPSRTLSRSKE